MTNPRADELFRLQSEIDALLTVNRQLYDDILRLLDLQDAVRSVCAAGTASELIGVTLIAARAISEARWARWYEVGTDDNGPILLVTALGGEPAVTAAGTVRAEGIPWQVIRRRRPVCLDDPQGDRRYCPDADALCGERAAGVFVVPVHPGIGTTCAVEAMRIDRSGFDDDTRRRLETLAAVAALRLQAFRLAEAAPASATAPGGIAKPRKRAAVPLTVPLFSDGRQ